jgi:hypothetical protein
VLRQVTAPSIPTKVRLSGIPQRYSGIPPSGLHCGFQVQGQNPAVFFRNGSWALLIVDGSR